MNEMPQYIKHKGPLMLRKPPKVGFKDSGWHRTAFGQVQGTFIPEMHVACDWDKLLDELHLTEEAARLAVATNDKLGANLRVFVPRMHRARYVPEDVLTLLNLSRESRDGPLAVANIRRWDADAE